MREDNNTTYDALKDALDKLVRRDATLGSFGMKKEKDFTKPRNPSGQDAGAISLRGDRSSLLENNE